MSLIYRFFGMPWNAYDAIDVLKRSGKSQAQVIVESRDYTNGSLRPYIKLDNDKKYYFSGEFDRINKIDKCVEELRKEGIIAGVTFVA